VSFPLRRILCPVDFSLPSTNAFHYALAVAAWFDAHVAVEHVHRLRQPIAALSVSGPYPGLWPAEPSATTDAERDQLANNLRSFVAAEAAGRQDVSWHLDESPEIAECIVHRAAALQAELIVVGTHGRSGPRRFLVGSTAERVLRTAPCAVLAVPPHAPRIAGTVARLDHVLCAVDFSPVSEQALDCSLAITARTGAALTVAHIVELPPDIPDIPQADLSGYRRARFDRARACMEQLLSVHVRGHARVTNLLLAGRAGSELLRLAREQQTDLMVMGVHARNAADIVLFGSVTHYVLRDAPCPVLTVRK
jgi:nucleotide-binding universal stress UspA family protein